MAAILLGNGFSIAYNPQMFSYDALREGAELPDHLTHIFDTVGTSDFEHVMRRLNQARELLQHYDDTEDAREALKADADLVRTSLITALTEHHPASADQVDDEEKDTCAAFLGHYDRIFTTNYDLLLYWVLYPRLKDQFTDGFRGYQTIAWQNGDVEQEVYYLHGALHLYRNGTRTLKRTYGGGVPILDQLNDAMEQGELPLFVSEGTWQQKKAAIDDSGYLRFAHGKLLNNRHALTLYGFGFHSNDRHIVDAIAKSRTPSLEVVLHSGASAGARRTIEQRAERLQERMELNQNREVPLSFTESDDFEVWR